MLYRRSKMQMSGGVKKIVIVLEFVYGCGLCQVTATAEQYTGKVVGSVRCV